MQTTDSQSTQQSSENPYHFRDLLWKQASRPSNESPNQLTAKPAISISRKSLSWNFAIVKLAVTIRLPAKPTAVSPSEVIHEGIC